ncbi:acyl carrier protein [Pseudobutyrivibrio sp. ACV-2]|uniref:acyl carrier protein n=1 Tax=Pseudobutyrivibrio sp. ACV-2 TaxID=1520801 RepID=UPI00089D961F|nr:phosphopantetheine-binding protein [Pseudobutyrivibrio sp. ACV-2]SEA76910.1 acyl carrier protein [Pseudobutyrivibrio sp. ACV-2]
MNELFESIKGIIIDIADIPEDEVTLDSAMIDDLCLSSIEIMTIIGDIEAKYGIKFSSDDLSKIRNIADLIQTTESKMD